MVKAIIIAKSLPLSSHPRHLSSDNTLAVLLLLIASRATRNPIQVDEILRRDGSDWSVSTATTQQLPEESFPSEPMVTDTAAPTSLAGGRENRAGLEFEVHGMQSAVHGIESADQFIFLSWPVIRLPLSFSRPSVLSDLMLSLE